MMPVQLALLCGAVLLIAFLYSAVGHAGASGYIAVMSLAGLAPTFIKPTALMLNILVACLASWQFYRAGHVSWRLAWPFVVLSIPFAFLGGYLNLPARAFKILVGVILLYSAARFLLRARPEPEPEPRVPPLRASLCVGAGLGFLSGLTGTGGGIFLTPLLIFARWARTKTASGTSAVFILVNSVAGLLGTLNHTRELPSFALPLALAAVAGGSVGSYLGSRRFSPVLIKRFLACVLTVAAVKFIAT
jgi:uncharacterized protein